MALLKRKRIKKWSLFIIGSFLIAIGIGIIVVKTLLDYQYEKQESKLIDLYIESTTNEYQNVQADNSETKTSNDLSISEKYLGVLEIPTINLKKGFFEKNSSLNTISKNVEILEESDMPNIENGHLILAGHNGNSSVSYFDKLNKLEKNDVVNVFYNNIKYTYKIDNIYEIDKNGTANIKQNKKTTIIALITCKKYSDDKQIVFIGNLVDKENY